MSVSPLKFKSHRHSGFTLVELAIVLMIIGLLIGGILRGQELMNNARINTTIQQVKAYEGAVTTFNDAYQALPGDMPTATARLPGCGTGNTNFCVNGNGNSIVGTTATNNFNRNQLNNNVAERETIMFWKHLSLAHLISGITPNGNPASPEWGRTHPAAPLRGGFHALYLATTSGQSIVGNGLYIRMQTPLTGTSAYNGTGGITNPLEAASPKEAAQIDRKMDDGRPNLGSVMSDDGIGGASGCEGNAYDPRVLVNLCVMYFKIF